MRARPRARAVQRSAVIIGTPMPATTRVVQIEPAPIPTLTASTPRSISASVASAVATLPATMSTSGNCAPKRCDHVEDALRVAVRRVDDEHVHVRAATSASARLDASSRATPIAAPHRSRPSESLHALRILDRLLNVLDGDQSLQHGSRRSTTSSFSTLCSVQDLARLSSVVPTGTVKSGSRVIDVGDRPV